MAGAAQGGGQTATPNIMAQGGQGVQAAGLATANMMDYGPGTLAQTDISQYQNPYTEQVIKANEADILRGATMGLNQLGAQATQARAFGGSRHGIAESELGRQTAQQLAQSSANLRMQGFNQAQQMAQQDIQNRLASAAQLANIGQTGYGIGRQTTQDVLAQGAQQQAIQQALIDAGRARFDQYVNYPQTSLGYLGSALGATPIPQTTTQSRQPGLFDYLTMAASVYAGRPGV